MIASYFRLCQRRPKSVLALLAFSTVVLALATYGKLDFSADREALFRVNETERRQREEFERRFGSWLDLIVVLDGGSPAERERCVLFLKKKLVQAAPLFDDLRATIELPGLPQQALYFLSPTELASIEADLAQHSQDLAGLASKGWSGVLYRAAASLGDGQSQRFFKAWEDSVESRGRAELEPLFPRFQIPERAFFTDGPSRHLIFFRTKDPLKARERVLQDAAPLNYSGRVVVLGQPLLQAQEKAETVRDAVLSTVLSVLLVQILLVYGFRETARPGLALLSLSFGLAWSTAWAAVAVETLNIITVNFLSITIGIGIDFSVHFLARYSEERCRTSSLEAMLATWQSTGWEIFVGALATAAAFFALMLTDFQAVIELGRIAGVAILLCFMSVVTVLPPLLFWHEQRKGFKPLEVATLPWVLRLERWLRRFPKKALAIGFSIVALMGAVGSQVRFDYNLLNLQSASFEAVEYEKQSGFSTLAAFVMAKSPEQALELKEQFELLPSVSRAVTVAESFPQQLDLKEPRVVSIVTQAQALPKPTFDPEAEPDWSRLSALSEQPGSPEWMRTLARSGPGPAEAVWKQMEAYLYRELSVLLDFLHPHQTGLQIEDWKSGLPDLLRYSQADGTTLLRVQAKESLWERAPLERFTAEVSGVSEQAIGPPFLIRDYLEQMRKSYYDAVEYAVVAIILLLLLYFRALVTTFIALVPKVAGTLVMLGAMALCGIDFNPANCMALPLTLGIGLVFGIHAVHRCLEHPDQLLVEGSTGKSISLAAWTDIVSFATMLTASNPGIFSIGFVMAVGVAANLLATYTLVPPLVVLFRRHL